MIIERIEEKVSAIRAAQNCISTINSMKPGAIEPEVQAMLSELMVDLFEIQDEQELAA